MSVALRLKCIIRLCLPALVLSLAITSSAQVAIPPVKAEFYKPDDLVALRPLVGRRVTLKGTPLRAGQSKSGDVCYLNFSLERDQTVSLVFFEPQKGESTIRQKLDQYIGKQVRVSGKLAEYKGSLQLQVSDLTDIQIIP